VEPQAKEARHIRVKPPNVLTVMVGALVIAIYGWQNGPRWSDIASGEHPDPAAGKPASAHR
jgi:hypothetical protein